MGQQGQPQYHSMAIYIQQSLDDKGRNSSRRICGAGNDSEGHSSMGYQPLVYIIKKSCAVDVRVRICSLFQASNFEE